ncbi:hypothetical protein MCAP1_001800 [Malassezia caprae]|uniref:Uncharacterized protein n=1 Tax=Malassezia caprae TaxID=1381934 RepID=A0AAF0IVD6_9BASI|nr:hypothetical protein MCAP1_001800 [Malassezia caprae]
MSYATPFLAEPVEDVPSMQLGITFPWEKTTESTLLGGQAHFLQLDMAELESEEDSESHDCVAQHTSATPPMPTAVATEYAVPAQSAPAIKEVRAGPETPFDMYEDALLQEHGVARAETGAPAEPEPPSSTPKAPSASHDIVCPMVEAPAEDNYDEFAHDTPLHNPHLEASPAVYPSPHEPPTSPHWVPEMHDRSAALQTTTSQAPNDALTVPQAPQAESPDPHDALGISGMPQQAPHTWEAFPRFTPETHPWSPSDTVDEPVRRSGRMLPTRRSAPDTCKLEGRREQPAVRTLKSKASRFFKKVLPSKQRSADSQPSSTNRFSRASRLPFRSQKSEPTVPQVPDEHNYMSMNAPSDARPNSLFGTAPSATMQSPPPMVPNMLDRQEPSPYYSPEPSVPSSPQTASHRLSFSSFRRQDATGTPRPMSLFSLFKKRQQEPMSLSRQASNGRLPHCNVVEEPLPVAVEAQRQESLYRSHSRRRSLGGWEERESQPSVHARAPSVVPEACEPESPLEDVPDVSQLPTEQSTILSHGYETAIEGHESFAPVTNTPLFPGDWQPQKEPMPANEDESPMDEPPVVEEQDTNLRQESELPEQHLDSFPAQHLDSLPEQHLDSFPEQHLDSLPENTKRLSLGLDENVWTLDLNFGATGESEPSRNPFLASRTKEEPDLHDWFGEGFGQDPVLPMQSHGESMELAN